MLGLCATILAAAALYFARSVLVPLAFSMSAIALLLPFQQLLATRIPKLLASTVVIVTTLL
jgi:AI-2 transport protein TqsA